MCIDYILHNKMFGKNYDQEIIGLNKQISDLTSLLQKTTKVMIEMDNILKERINGFEKLFLNVVKVQQSHKEAIIHLSKKI